MVNLPNEKQVSVLRRYIMEYIILSLTAAVIYLFILYNNLNSFITETMAKQQERSIIVIEKNTAVIQTLNSK